jgi:nitrate reductase assembly molybdenum cofactor insertion protein NarJ
VVEGGFSKRAAAELETIEKALEGKATWQIEELYTQAFDLNPVCALEIGWHLYGEQYERGRFLVRTRDLLSELEIEEIVELPDHLSTMLTALGRLEGADAKAFAANFLVPALRRMGKACDDSTNPILQLIVVARELAEREVGEVPIKEAPSIRQDLIQIGSSRKSKSAGRLFA